MSGLQFFKQVAAAGNLNGAVAQAGLVAKGEIPIALRWDFNALSNRHNNAKVANIQVVYPKSGSIARVYLQAINAYAPHTIATPLWQELLSSLEDQRFWLKGYAMAVTFDDINKRNST